MYPTKRRHNQHQNQGGNNRRQQQGRYQNQGGNQQRPRKNYAALREKFMNQARDAMSAGDRVLAEYYLQHADHYYRMQQEFLAERAERFQRHQAQNQNANAEEFAEAEDAAAAEGEDIEVTNVPNNSNVLPAFLTRQVPPTQQEEKPMVTANWEEE